MIRGVFLKFPSRGGVARSAGVVLHMKLFITAIALCAALTFSSCAAAEPVSVDLPSQTQQSAPTPSGTDASFQSPVPTPPGSEGSFSSPSPSPTPSGKKVVVLDAGHGGDDEGAIVNYETPDQVDEKDLNLDIALRVRDIYDADTNAGFDLELTRDSDVTASLDERVSLRDTADMFVSVHFNTSDDSTEHGASAYYWPMLDADARGINFRGKQLAQLLFSYVSGVTGVWDDGVVSDDLYVLKQSKIPATLLELGFLTNQYDFNKIMTPSYRQTLAQKIYDGICEAVTQLQ